MMRMFEEALDQEDISFMTHTTHLYHYFSEYMYILDYVLSMTSLWQTVCA